jgi:hypothetical protein
MNRRRFLIYPMVGALALASLGLSQPATTAAQSNVVNS